MNGITARTDAQSILIDDPDFLRVVVRRFLQNVLNEEFLDEIGAAPYQRSTERVGYRNGNYQRQVKTRVGRIELTVPRDREGNFRTELFERYQRSEKALVTTMAEMYLQGVSTRKVSNIVEELCGHSVSKSQVSDLSKQLDKDFEQWRTRPLEGKWKYALFDAIYLKVREEGRVRSVAALTAIGINEKGHREVLGCCMASGEDKMEWKNFIRSLKQRGMNVPEFVVSDNHKGLREAIVEELTQALWQRCQVHYMRNFMAKMSKKAASEMVPLLRSVFQSSDLDSATKAKIILLDRLIEKGLEEVADWIENTIDDTLNVLNLPYGHRKRMCTTNMIERHNEEIRRRTKVIRIFPNRESCMRVVTSVCLEASESWEERRYLTFGGGQS